MVSKPALRLVLQPAQDAQASHVIFVVEGLVQVVELRFQPDTEVSIEHMPFLLLVRGGSAKICLISLGHGPGNTFLLGHVGRPRENVCIPYQIAHAVCRGD